MRCLIYVGILSSDEELERMGSASRYSISDMVYDWDGELMLSFSRLLSGPAYWSDMLYGSYGDF
jgi:hypothetical protein